MLRRMSIQSIYVHQRRTIFPFRHNLTERLIAIEEVVIGYVVLEKMMAVLL